MADKFVCMVRIARNAGKFNRPQPKDFLIGLGGVLNLRAAPEGF